MKERVRVCLIDDEPDIREIYEKRFTLDGFEVGVAANGEEGLALIHSFQPQIILLDLQMPVKNGIDVLEALHAEGTLGAVPIILLTNINSAEIMEKTVKFNVKLHLLIKSMITPKTAVEYVRDLLKNTKETGTPKNQ